MYCYVYILKIHQNDSQTFVFLFISAIPVLNIPQDTYTAVYGQQLVIDCTIQSANPSVTNIYWTRQSGGNTVTINNGDGGYQGSTPQTPALTINFVTTAHTGTYRCHGTNVVGTGSSNQAAVTITGGLYSSFKQLFLEFCI